MNERDRLLAEGPRVAPEPPTADGSVVAPPTRPRPSTVAAPARARKVPPGLIRLFPLVLFGAVLAANAGAGRYAVWVIIPIVLAASLIRIVRKARQ